MPRIDTTIEIDAAPDAVCQVLADFGAYPDWNPFIPSIEGVQEVGERLTVRLAPPDGRAMTFNPSVRAFDESRELRWLGHLLLPGVFDGEHSFRLEPNTAGGTTFTQSETFRGVLAFPMLWFIRKNTTRGFQDMNEALKARAERPAEASP